MTKTEMLGNIATIMIVLAYVPQLINVIKTKSTVGMTTPFIATLLTALSCFLMYGILIKNLPLMITNGFSVVQIGVIAYYKIKYK